MRTGRIPNALTAAAALAGLTLATLGLIQTTLPMAIAGGVLGLALMLPGRVLGGVTLGTSGGADEVAVLGTWCSGASARRRQDGDRGYDRDAAS